ncbi:MAG: type IV secretion system protein [Wolbachia endosymbiont of Meromenopon meropis]|nr:type IV secretion system protein [Wolbachia endosymbiont of Meromenopon meropis]
MHKFLLIVILFLLFGCEYRCIKPENLSNLREKLDVISTEQRWIDSGVSISDRVKITEISIVPNKINFCPKQYEDFAIQPDIQDIILSKFDLKAGDLINFSIIGNKMCKSKEDNAKIRYVKIDEKCSNKEEEYFARILNQEECQAIWQDGEYKYTMCPNKLIIGNAEWLQGQEYWNLNSLKSDQKKRIEENIGDIYSVKHRENINCDKLSSYKRSNIDTHILNLICKNTCHFSSKNCVEIESNVIDDIDLIKNFDDTSIITRAKMNRLTQVAKEISEREQIKTYIPSLVVSMEKEELEPQRGNIRTNYNYEIKNNHSKGEKLTFTFICEEKCKGGYNIRITRVPNSINLKDSLYISVFDKFPEHNPGEDQTDIPVDTSKVHNIQYMENLKEKLKGKSGTIYYGIKDHNCDYKENQGQFSINLTIKEPPKRTFSTIYNFFDEKIKIAFFGSNYKNLNTTIHSSGSSPIELLYQSLINSNRTKTIRSTIITLLLLYIVLYALYYFFGLTHVSIYEFLIICIKMGIIAQLLRDNSWNFFYKNAFSIFINTPKQLIEIANFRSTTLNVFEFLDLPLNRLLSSHSVLLILSLIFSGPLGIVSFGLVIWGLIILMLSIFNTLFSFIVSVAIVALLLSLTPIFIICLLFTYTRQMFHNWIRSLARFAIHPVILLIFISLISQAMDHIIYSLFNFEVCTTCILNINLKLFEFCVLYGYASRHTPNIAAMIAFVILGHTMKALAEASSRISDSLFSVYVHEEPAKQYQQNLMGLLGLDRESVYRRRTGRTNVSEFSDIATSKKLELPRTRPFRIQQGSGNPL